MSIGNDILYFIKEKNLTATQLFKNAQIDRFEGYDILNDRRVPDRDQMIRLCISLGLNQIETTGFFNEYGYPLLNPEDERESVILFALKQGSDVDSVNEALEGFGMELL